MIEEELYSDSDHSSVYTSEDDFDFDRSNQMRLRKIKVEDTITHNGSQGDLTGTNKSNNELKFSVRRLDTITDNGGRVSALSGAAAAQQMEMEKTGEDFGRKFKQVKRVVTIMNLDEEEDERTDSNKDEEKEGEEEEKDDASVFKKSQKTDMNRATRAADLLKEIYSNDPNLT